MGVFMSASWLQQVEEAAKQFRTTEDFAALHPQEADVGNEELMEMTAAVYFQWLRQQASTRPGTASIQRADCDLVCLPPSPDAPSDDDGRGIGILFPRDHGEHISEWLEWIKEHTLTEMVTSCWIADQGDVTLVARLLARGFTSGFLCNWLCVDVKEFPLDCSQYRMMEGVTFRVIDAAHEDISLWDTCVEGHPCYKESVEKIKQMHQASKESHGRLIMFGAFQGEEPLASATLYLGNGKNNNKGVAGLYEVEVVRKCRGKGVGKAISYATCYYAELLGYRYILGNASEEGTPMYYKLGFRNFGHGRVYFLSPQVLFSSPVGEDEIRFIEAIGNEDEKVYLDRQYKKKFRSFVLTCQLTAIQLALFIGKHDVARTLHSQGFLLDIMSAYELGWADEIILLVQENRDLLEWRRGEHKLTPLHEAARDNLEPLARVLLKTKPNMKAVDGTFQGTPLDWAEQCGNQEIVALFQKHIKSMVPKKNKNKKKKK